MKGGGVKWRCLQEKASLFLENYDHDAALGEQHRSAPRGLFSLRLTCFRMSGV